MDANNHYPWYERTKWERFCDFVGNAIEWFKYISTAFVGFVLFAFATLGAVLLWMNIRGTFSLFLAIIVSLIALSLLNLFLLSLEW